MGLAFPSVKSWIGHGRPIKLFLTKKTKCCLYYLTVYLGVTEYFDSPETPGIGPNFTEKVGPHTNDMLFFTTKYSTTNIYVFEYQI